MNDTPIELDYTLLVDEAMRGVVKKALLYAQAHGLDDKNHFYISFDTNCPGVELSPALRSQYPQDMTIVLQHQYWDLEVHDTYFSIMLSFNNVPEKLTIPFDALTAFADPGVRFGLQFHERPDADDALNDEPPVTSFEDDVAQRDDDDEAEKVVSLDAFRKN